MFMVLRDAKGAPAAVWIGSTNWSVTGLCTQANNALVIKNPTLAASYLVDRKALKQAGALAPESSKNANATPHTVKRGHVSVWFPPTPSKEHLEFCCDLINGAKQGILFMMPSSEWKGLKTQDGWQTSCFKVPALIREFDFWHGPES